MGARNAIARLARPEVGLADVAIADSSDARVRKAWVDLRVSAMPRSNRLSDSLREKLLAYKDTKGRGWWELTREDLHRQLGLVTPTCRSWSWTNPAQRTIPFREFGRA